MHEWKMGQIPKVIERFESQYSQFFYDKIFNAGEVDTVSFIALIRISITPYKSRPATKGWSLQRSNKIARKHTDICIMLRWKWLCAEIYESRVGTFLISNF